MNLLLNLQLVFLLFFHISCALAQKILLTGGAGFIGSHVAQTLLQRGDAVVIIDNFNDAYDIAIKKYNVSMIQKSDLFGRLTVYPVDICNTEKMMEIFAFEQPDVICHLAARAGVRMSVLEPYECYRSNATGTLTIFELARQFGIKHIVNASSSSIYNSSSGNGSLSESRNVDKQTSPYGVTKRSGELLAYVYHYLHGISITNLRFFSVYGPRGRTDMAPFIFMDAIYNDRPIFVYGDGSVVRDFTFIEDIVAGVVSAIDNPLGYQILNIGRGEPIVLGDFIDIMETIIGKKALIQYMPGYPCDAPFTHADITKASALLQYQPQTSVVCGLKKMYDWYKNEFLSLELSKKKNKSLITMNNIEIYNLE